MKREGENFEGGGLKRSRFIDGADEKFWVSVSGSDEDEEDGSNSSSSENEMDEKRDTIDYGIEMNANLDGVNEADQSRGNLRDFDLNVTAFEMEDSGMEQGWFQEYPQESPGINEKKARNKRQRVLVPSLIDLSLQAVAKNAERIVSLELVPDMLIRRLTNLLCDMRKMDVYMLNLLLKGSPTVIRVKNCSWLTEEQFRQTFENFEIQSLRVLQLDLCGQCMLDVALKNALARSLNSLPNLAIVSLRGACRLSDKGIKALVLAAPALMSINLGQCTLLTSAAIGYIADSLGTKLRELYMDDCPKIYPMLILPALKKFEHLEVLSVAGNSTVSDQFISEVIPVCGRGIKELDLANCLEVTDESLKIIGRTCADLCSLNISNLPNLTDQGIEYLARGCTSIQKLKLCNNGFSDEAIAAFLETCGGSLMELLLNNVEKVGPNTAASLAKCSKLSILDISWCRGITNEPLGLILDNCSSLRLLKIFGLTQISDEILNGHSNSLVQIIGFMFTPLLGSLSLNGPEEEFLRYSPLPDLEMNM